MIEGEYDSKVFLTAQWLQKGAKYARIILSIGMPIGRFNGLSSNEMTEIFG